MLYLEGGVGSEKYGDILKIPYGRITLNSVTLGMSGSHYHFLTSQIFLKDSQKYFTIQLMKNSSLSLRNFEVLSIGGRKRETCQSASHIANAEKMLSRYTIILEAIFTNLYPQSSLSNVYAD